MIKINYNLKAQDLIPKIKRLWELSAPKIRAIEKSYSPGKGAPVFTIKGKYVTKGWTEWTRGFQYGSAILQYDATGDKSFLKTGRDMTLKMMAPHLSHTGVHDHGFNNVSTYGNLWRLMQEGKLAENNWERNFYVLALKLSGAIQAHRWTQLDDKSGFIYSFNGPHSLFVDSIRSLRSLALAHLFGHYLMEENDKEISLLDRLIKHAYTTAKYNVYYGDGRDDHDTPGRVAHESIFNTYDYTYRCPNSQQGFSPFTTWTRGLAWVILGFTEELEFLNILNDNELKPFGGRKIIERMMLEAALVTGDFYIKNTPTDGIPYWDTGAPGLKKLGDYLGKPANPFNDYEPVDSSAASIAAQGLLRLGYYLAGRGVPKEGKRYWQAGLTILNTLFDEPYLSLNKRHQGLILHSIYHRPKGWDYIPKNSKIPVNESSMWGDYHAREAAVYITRIVKKGIYYAFFGPVPKKRNLIIYEKS
jgi:hypothetical protein